MALAVVPFSMVTLTALVVHSVSKGCNWNLTQKPFPNTASLGWQQELIASFLSNPTIKVYLQKTHNGLPAGHSMSAQLSWTWQCKSEIKSFQETATTISIAVKPFYGREANHAIL